MLERLRDRATRLVSLCLAFVCLTLVCPGSVAVARADGLALPSSALQSCGPRAKRIDGLCIVALSEPRSKFVDRLRHATAPSTASTSTTTCNAGFSMCFGGVCSDTQNDPANCGGCGDACSAGQICAAGSCVVGTAPTATIAVTPGRTFTATGLKGGPFLPASVTYTVTASAGTVNWKVAGLPDWLTASASGGTADTTGSSTVTFTVNAAAAGHDVGTLDDTIQFANTSSGKQIIQVSTKLAVVQPTLTSSVNPGVADQWITFTGTVPGPLDPGSTMSIAYGGQVLETAPVTVIGGEATALALGFSHSCAVTPSGGVKCWGDNFYGQLGDGTTSSSTVPVDVVGLTGPVLSLATGSGFTCAVVQDPSNGPTAVCWGQNDYGELGNGTTSIAPNPTPTAIASLTGNAAQIFAGSGKHACAITTGGALKCWGNNTNGALGNNSTTNSSVPVQVSGLTSGVAAAALGSLHTCALTTGGAVECWGLNANGEVGDNTTTDRSIPVAVSGLTRDVARIAAGDYHTCAVTTGGALSCWGYNANGRLGDGTQTNRSVPTTVSGFSSGAADVTAGSAYGCAVTTGGGVQCWGSNAYGELGASAITVGADSPVPVAVDGLTSGTARIVVAANQSCALSTSGTVRCWGYNQDGELGDGTKTDRSTWVANTTLNILGAQFVGNFAVGSYPLTAIYQGGGSAVSATSPVLQQVIGKAPGVPGLALCTTSACNVASGTGFPYGGTLTLVGGFNPGDLTPTGTIRFFDGATAITSNLALTNGQVSMVNHGFTVGAHSITAHYSGDGQYQAGVSAAYALTITKASTGLGLTATPATVLPGGTATLTATASAVVPGGGAPTGSVVFKDGSTTLGTVPLTSGVARLSAGFSLSGAHALSATYAGSSTYKGSTGAASLTVDARTGTPTRVNGVTNGAQQQPSIAALPGGGWVVVWASQGEDGGGFGVYGRIFRADGVAAGNEFRVNSHFVGDQTAPAVAALRGGGFVVVWTSSGQDGDHRGIYLQRYGVSGAPVGNETAVNTITAGDQAEPAIAAIADGGFVVVWSSKPSSGTAAIYARRWSAAGVASTASEFRVDTPTSANPSAPTVAGFGAGGFLVAWVSTKADKTSDGIRGQVFSSASAKVGSAFRIDGGGATDSQPKLAPLSDGGAVAVWTATTGGAKWVAAQRLTASATKSAGELHLSGAAAVDQWQPTVAAFADGGYVVAWTSQATATTSGLHLRRFRQAGTAADAEQVLAVGGATALTQPALATTFDTAFVLGLTAAAPLAKGTEVYVQRYTLAAPAPSQRRP